VCVCIFPYRYTESHVGMYVFPYIRTEFMVVFLHIYVHTHRVSMCVCLNTCICMRRLHFGVYIFTCMYAEFGWVCMWLRVYTQRLHVFVFISMYRYTELYVLVCIFAYMYTEFEWMCVHGMIVSACTHVRGTG